MDVSNYTCEKPKIAIIPKCLDEFKVGDGHYCSTCEDGYPDVSLLFRFCKKFPDSIDFKVPTIPPMETLIARGLPKEVAEVIKMRTEIRQKRRSTRPHVELQQSPHPFDNCLWGTVSGAERDIYNCFRCKEGYSSVSGGCVVSTLTGCIELGIMKKKCLFCNVYDGYFGRTNDGKCTKASTQAKIALE